MSTNTIITIERQYGSGGHLIGEKLAESLGIPFYDSELIKVAAKESGICEEIFESFDEKPTTSFLYSLVMDPYSLGYNSNSFDLPLNHKVFLAAFDTIKELASKGPCVFVGRCADYALEDFDNCISVYVHAPFEDRIKRIENEYGIPSGKSKEMLMKKDKQRSSYYNYYSSNKWGDAKSYDLCLNSSFLGIDGSVEMIKKVIDMKESQK